MGVRFLLLVAVGLQAGVCGRIAYGWSDQDDLVDSDDYDEFKDFDEFQKFLGRDLDDSSTWDNSVNEMEDGDDFDDYDDQMLANLFQSEVEEETPSPPTEPLSPADDPLPPSNPPSSPTPPDDTPLPSTPESSQDESFPPTTAITSLVEPALLAEGQEESALVVVLVMFAGTFLAVFIIYSVLARGAHRKTPSTAVRQPKNQEEVSRLLKARGSL